MHLQLINDQGVAEITSMSTGWVRNQRWRRKHDEEHSLTIDPVMIGSSPRYRLDDVMAWVDGLGGEQ